MCKNKVRSAVNREVRAALAAIIRKIRSVYTVLEIAPLS